MVFLKEISSQADGVLNRGFIHDKAWAFELKHRLDNPSFVETASLNPSGILSCQSATTIKLPEGASLSGTLGIDGSAVINAMYPLKPFNGLNMTVRAQHKLNAKTTGIDVTAEYKKAPFHAKLNVSPFTQAWTLNSSTAFKPPIADNESCSDLITLSAELTGTGDPGATKLSWGASYTHPVRDHQIVGALRMSPLGLKSVGKVSLSVAAKSPKTWGSELAAEYTYVPQEDRSEVAIGAFWYLDPATKLTSLKAKLDHEGKVAAVLSHKVSDSVAMSIGAQFDATRKMVTAEQPDSVKYGFKLNFLA